MKWKNDPKGLNHREPMRLQSARHRTLKQLPAPELEVDFGRQLNHKAYAFNDPWSESGWHWMDLNLDLRDYEEIYGDSGDLVVENTMARLLLPDGLAGIHFSGLRISVCEPESIAPPSLQDDAWLPDESLTDRLVDFFNRLYEQKEISWNHFSHEELSVFRTLAAEIPDKKFYGHLVILLLLEPFWIRSAAAVRLAGKDWMDDFRQLVRHVLVKFDPPSCLWSAWRTHRYAERFPEPVELLWFMLAVQGGSIRRAGVLMKWKLRSRILAELETVPDELRLGEALIWAEIHHMGGNVWIYQQMRLHGGLSIVLPFVDDNRPWFVEFWKETVFWLVKHQAALTNEVTFLILQWALHCHLEARHHNTDGRAFSWKGRSVARCSQSANEYAEALRKPWTEISWQPLGMEFAWVAENDVPWTVHELTTGKDLYEEGQFMSHCVASYAHHCARGDSAIFSLRKAGQRRITIELNPQNRSIRQAHGRFNSLPSPKEKQVIGRWLRSIAPPPTQSPPT